MSLHRVLGALACAGWLAACAEGPATSPSPGAGNPPGFAPTAEAGATRQIVVQPGQSLGRIAEAYHVSSRAIIAANHLEPPYKLKAGARLTIPGAGPLPTAQKSEHAKSAGPATPSAASATAAAVAPTHARAGRAAAPDVIPLDPPKAKGGGLAASTGTAPSSASAPPVSGGSGDTRKEIPLD